jgi:hypothetical protein
VLYFPCIFANIQATAHLAIAKKTRVCPNKPTRRIDVIPQIAPTDTTVLAHLIPIL